MTDNQQLSATAVSDAFKAGFDSPWGRHADDQQVSAGRSKNVAELPGCRAWRGIKDGKADICGWCPDKTVADLFGLGLGLELNHGICEPCRAALLGTINAIPSVENCGGSSMSGMTPLPLVEFRRLLRLRQPRLTIDDFALLTGRGRSHLSQVLHGRRAGGYTWTRIKAACTPDEWAALLKLEHCATWNRQAEARQHEVAA